MRPGIGVRIVAGLMALVFVLPTAIVIGTSVNPGQLILFPPRGFSLRWYHEIFTATRWTDAFLHSFQVGVLAGVLAMAAGTLLGLAAARGSGLLPGSVTTAIAMAPMVVPFVVLGVGFYIVGIQTGLGGTTLGLALAHSTIGIPFVFINVLASVGGIDRSVEEAARISGASPMATVGLVTLPLVAPAILVGGVLAFISSWDEVVIASFLTSPTFHTLPVEMFSDLRTGARPSTSAVASTVTLVSIALLALVTIGPLLRRQQMLRRR